ncbi:MAG TPA: efflux RND transporter periplasmic adaptor subunit [Polyangiaceae bacterium]|nr:efflux RND transporter periplasmic adaptor subunit [Polyangiaceae bacterium]
MSRLLSALSLLVSLVAPLACTENDRHLHEEDHAATSHDDHGPEPEADAKGTREVVELAEKALTNVTIRTEKVARRRIVDALRLPAEVQPHPDQIAHITPLVTSQVTEVKARPGDKVKQGDILAVLKNVQLGEARAEIAQAKAALEVARDQLGRQEQLVGAGVGAQKSYVEAQGAVKQAEASLAAAVSRAQVYGGSGGSGATTVIRSPLAGTVVERHATAGEVASPDQQLFVIANIDPVWVVGRAYESDLPLLQKSQGAVIKLKSYPERSWRGAISYVAPTLDARTRTAEVRVELDNPDLVLKPGMFATIIPTGPSDRATDASTNLAVPTSAIQRDGDQYLAFVAKGARSFEPRVLTLGTRGVDYVEVLEGLAEGEPVVVEGTFILKSEAAKHELGGGHSH